MALEDLDTFPTLVPVPELDAHIIRGRKNEGKRGVNADGSNVVGMRLEGGDLFGGVVVIDSQLEII